MTALRYCPWCGGGKHPAKWFYTSGILICYSCLDREFRYRSLPFCDGFEPSRKQLSPKESEQWFKDKTAYYKKMWDEIDEQVKREDPEIYAELAELDKKWKIELEKRQSERENLNAQEEIHARERSGERHPEPWERTWLASLPRH